MDAQLDPETEARLNQLAEARHRSPEAILREAAERYLDREERPGEASSNQHPSGQPWPRRNPVGGIITPV